MIAIRQADPPPARFTRRGRPGGVSNIHQIHIHATRGPTVMEAQVQATENWFANGPDRGGWGSSADFVVGPDRRVNGQVVIVQFKDWVSQFGSWSAGYGSYGARLEWGAAEVGVAIEVAQPPRFDRTTQKYVGGDSDVDYTLETMEAVVWLCQYLNSEIARLGGTPIPAVRLPYWSQLRSEAVPRGYIGHEDLENGHKLRKTDPGQMWNWREFMMMLEPNQLPPKLSRYEGVMAAWNSGTIPIGIENGVGVYRVTRRL